MRQVLREVGRTHSALAVAGQGVVDEGGIGQMQIGHDGPELLDGRAIARPRIAPLFLRDRLHATVHAVVRGIHQRLLRMPCGESPLRTGELGLRW